MNIFHEGKRTTEIVGKEIFLCIVAARHKLVPRVRVTQSLKEVSIGTVSKALNSIYGTISHVNTLYAKLL